jgi:hypothetical protein
MSDDYPSDDSIVATTFHGLTPNGSPCLLEMLAMEFGLCNAPTTFTLLMTHVLDPFIHQFVNVYLDDICIYSKSPEKHLDHIRQVFMALRRMNYLLKWSNVSGLNGKPNILVILLEMALFEHPYLK